MLVLAVIAIASIMGFAMLSSNAIKAQVSHNASQATSADYVAESAVEAALYYIQHPSERPAAWTTTPGYYIHATGQTLGSTVPGTFDLYVEETATKNQYTIRAIGRDNPAAPPRTVTALASVERVGIEDASYFGGNLTLPVRSTVSGLLKVAGSLVDNSTSTLMTVIEGPLDRTEYRVPDATTVNYYGADRADRMYIMADGTVGYAQQLTSAPTSTPAANADNPGRVFFYESSTTPDLLLSSGVTINGTLVVRGGGISVRASGLRINPEPGMPALVLQRDLNMFRTNVTLEANGVVYVGRNQTWTTMSGSSSGSRLDINGALVMPAGSAIGTPGIGGQLNLTVDLTATNVTDLSTELQPGTTLRLLAWND